MEAEHVSLSPATPTSLLGRTSESDEELPTPLPKKQIAILLLLLLTEPVSGFVIYPFVAKLVRELDITNGQEASIGYYVGLIESLFYVAQGLTILQWGRLSDRIGRRPVILFGQLGLAASLVTFGYSKTFAGVVIGRSLAGFLDGNVGVVKTMLGELTDDSNRARAFSLFPVTWITGATLAPMIGGALEHPADRFPSIFGPMKSKFWTTYPYMLPCLCAAALCFFTFVLGAVFLNETLDIKSFSTPKREEYQSLAQEPAPNFEANREQGDYEGPIEAANLTSRNPPSMRAVLIRPVLAAVLNYGTLAMLDIAYFSIITVFFAVPVSAGGLNFTPFQIGMIFAALGIVSGLVQVFLFPKVHKRFGAKRVLRFAIGSFFLVFPLFPLMHLAAKQLGSDSMTVWGLIMLLVCTNPVIDMGYSCSFMFVTSSSPAPNLLGSVNGLAQTIVSMVRAVGPAGATALFSLSTNRHWLGGYAIYWLMCALTAAALWSTTLLPESESSKRGIK